MSWQAIRWLFLRGLALTYLAAFGSLFAQVDGLLGSGGILPAARFLGAARAALGADAYRRLPTLAWLGGGSDATLHALSVAGIAAAVLLACDLAPALAALAAWACYLSLAAVGRDFFFFQWDALLLEAGFLAIFLAPWRLRPARAVRPDAAPPPLAALALRLLLFRLMFLSGYVKLTAHVPAWRDLTALDFHFFTQPLPTPLAWYAAALPHRIHAAATVAVLAIELAAPFLVFGPRRGRAAAFALLAALQVAIALTGNFGFFNLLSLVLCLAVLDDGCLPARIAARIGREAGPAPAVQRGVMGGVAALSLVLALGASGPALVRSNVWAPFAAAARAAAPLRLAGNYGLFRDMTLERAEIVIEGSEDGETWRPYEFRWKPGDPARGLPVAFLHMPRLDWQMWFASLYGPDESPWFGALIRRLLEGSPAVLALLEKNPFPAKPPRYIQAVLYDYRFTTPEERRAGGGVWKREWRATYWPPETLTR
jgi:hypothetical protein